MSTNEGKVDSGNGNVLSDNDLPSPSVDNADNRAVLIERARGFLSSPQIRYEGVAAKRHFLADKGLSDAEIADLIRETAPSVPPRTYPQLPPSNLPVLLAGLVRIMKWAAGGSLALLLIYYRFILPRLTETFMARHSIMGHQNTLLKQLVGSLETTREAQKSTFATLPKVEPLHEIVPYRDCQTLADIVAAKEAKPPPKIPPYTVLSCALADFVAKGEQPTTEELFHEISSKLPWIEGNTSYCDQLWTMLSTNPKYFVADDSDSPTVRWSHTTPPPPPLSPLVSSLENLKSGLPSPTSSASSSRFQHTLQTFIDFTGYLTAQVYTVSTAGLGYRPPGTHTASLSPQEEEVRKEIRALKGLVLNRFVNATLLR
ncbi:uncharacterized protein STEHIDRAFT_167855 [Stereum hirsutum FP-91666 SS1]|uniref:uncharacterized protein n=1 Tax=Stereum hirsutum (strain FP-91666) TaxID=721885 RepID=UPI000440CD88|nr:uncharacterized protein STEHIDRAFT_167855 [Stereum hirsutum FP-91666 SS1]EIM88599.1 hypothetical protein STEHIDRAFT_167855 [Stereum hirsutum FP-91666 SS1]